MKKDKDLVERLITMDEFDKITENRKRRFRINYCIMDGTIRTDKIFQKKSYVRNFLDDPTVSKVKIYVGDVVDKI